MSTTFLIHPEYDSVSQCWRICVDGELVACVGNRPRGAAKRYAEYMVRAANNHETMVSILRAIEKNYRANQPFSDIMLAQVRDALEAVRAYERPAVET